jgi:hypothetical protein
MTEPGAVLAQPELTVEVLDAPAGDFDVRVARGSVTV